MFKHEWYFDHPGIGELLTILLTWAENSYFAHVILLESIFKVTKIASIVFLASKVCDKIPARYEDVIDVVENIKINTLYVFVPQ